MTGIASMSRRQIWVKLLLYPGHTLPTAAAPVVVAIGLAIRDGVFAAIPALLAFSGSWLIHIGGVFEDNRQLLSRHPGIEEHPELSEAVRNGTLTLAELRWAVLGCFGLAALTAPYFFHIGGLPALAIGVAGAAASLGYAGGPRPYATLGLAEPVFLIMFGFAAVIGTYYAQAAELHGVAAAGRLALSGAPGACALGLPIGLLVTNVLIIDDIRDRDFDAAKGWLTWTVRYGVPGSRARYVASSILAYLVPFWLWLGAGFGAGSLLPLLTMPWALSIARAVCTAGRREEMLPLTPAASKLSLAYAMLLGAGVAMGL
jgi:1,4-dihydroxy-2-naphthoate octaprenyltransferase